MKDQSGSCTVGIWQRLVPESFEENTTQVALAERWQNHDDQLSGILRTPRHLQSPRPPPLPEEIPTSRPSSSGSRRAILMDSSLGYRDDLVNVIPAQDARNKTRADSLNLVRRWAFPQKGLHYLPAPRPTALNEGFFGLMYSQTPVIVPPVPTPEIRKSTRPSVSSQISGPWFRSESSDSPGCQIAGACMRLESRQAIPRPSESLTFIPWGPGVRTISAPKASSSTRRSRLMVSGMVRMSLYPFTAATKARAIPGVATLVGSNQNSFPRG